MFKKETAGLCCLVAFFTTHPMFINDKTNVADDILLANLRGHPVVIVSKKKPHLLHIIADGTGGILLCLQGVVQLLKKGLCFS